MEVKVSVDGVQRIVCGVAERTTCQEVVIALAQALGRTGRYTLKEKFKDFERNLTPDERVLESLAKYGQHSREVHLFLLHNGPSLGVAGGDAPRRGSQQVPLRRGDDIGGRGRRGSGSCASHRQSLPPLSRLRLRAEQSQNGEEKKPKRKSLTLVEEAFGWLENLSRNGRPHRGREKEKGRETERRKGGNSDSSPSACQDCWSPGGVCGLGCQQRTTVTAQQQQRRHFLDDLGSGRTHDRDNNGNHSGEANKNGDARRDQDLNVVKAKAERKPEPQPVRKARVPRPLPPPPPPPLPTHKREDEKLQALLLHQRARLHELQLQLDSTDAQIRELEGRQATGPLQGAEGELADEESEGEELAFWENELKAEEGYERDLQGQFREMKEKAAECKAKLEEYKCRLQGFDLARGKRAVLEAEALVEPGQEATSGEQKPAVPSWTKPHSSTPCAGALQGGNVQQAKPPALNRADDEEAPTPTAAPHRPHVRVSPQQTAAPQGGGTGQLREQWARVTDAQNKPETRPTSPVVHRSEITIHLSSTRV
ncbi:ras association domain-containing protein 8 [Conger conger]|uniref:ras association domain-containing protein 8 n=1 Tax=Conger conger TaxID=82655 RepID=UPI002A598C0C|nr:ras association domain-containing protein 8 [Conger conger]